MNPVEILDSKASQITIDDIENIVPDLLEHFSGKINKLAAITYGNSNPVGRAAFYEWATKTFKDGGKSFFLAKRHWQQNRSVGPYLSKCLDRLSVTLRTTDFVAQQTCIPVCPACKLLGNKEPLTYHGKLLCCPTCSSESSRLGKIKNRNTHEEFEYRIRKAFSLHSRKGYCCPECKNFIPDSFLGHNEKVSCLYDNCSWFGLKSSLQIMSHPVGKIARNNTSLDGSGLKEERSLYEVINANAIAPDTMMEQWQRIEKELAMTREVMNLQYKRCSEDNSVNSFKKRSMYEAYIAFLEEDPAAMINYLLHGKSVGEKPIQSQIFQKYISIIENQLPLVLTVNGKEKEFFSLIDDGLDLFLGATDFISHVRESGIVANNTKEIFTGEKCKGPCFIGHLCEITDEKGNSLLSEVESYSFANIKMKPTVPERTIVCVYHYYLYPHYEMGSVTSLQRTRRKILDSLWKRLYGEKRPLKWEK